MFSRLAEAMGQPGLADDPRYATHGARGGPGTGAAGGGRDIRERARDKVREILSSHYPAYIDPAIDEEIRRRFPIVFSASDMQVGCGRW